MEGDKVPLYRAINTATTVTLTQADIVHSYWPEAVNQNNRNTKLRITAQGNSNYVGEIDIFYNRLSLNTLEPIEAIVGVNATDFEVTLSAAVEFKLEYKYNINPYDLNEEMTKNQLAPKKWNYQLKAALTSYCYIGNKDINVYFQYTTEEAETKKRIEIDMIYCFYAIYSSK